MVKSRITKLVSNNPVDNVIWVMWWNCFLRTPKVANLADIDKLQLSWSKQPLKSQSKEPLIILY